MDFFTVGPIALPAAPVLLVVAVLTAMSIGSWLTKRSEIGIEHALYSILSVGLPPPV
jgi:hypothetical protein